MLTFESDVNLYCNECVCSCIKTDLSALFFSSDTYRNVMVTPPTSTHCSFFACSALSGLIDSLLHSPTSPPGGRGHRWPIWCQQPPPNLLCLDLWFPKDILLWQSKKKKEKKILCPSDAMQEGIKDSKLMSSEQPELEQSDKTLSDISARPPGWTNKVPQLAFVVWAERPAAAAQHAQVQTKRKNNNNLIGWQNDTLFLLNHF